MPRFEVGHGGQPSHPVVAARSAIERALHLGRDVLATDAARRDRLRASGRLLTTGRGLIATRRAVRDALTHCLSQRLDGPVCIGDSRPSVILGGYEPEMTALADALRSDARLRTAVACSGADTVAQAIADGPAAVIVDARLTDVSWSDVADEVHRWRRDTLIAVWGDNGLLARHSPTVDLVLPTTTPPDRLASALASAVNAC